MLPRRLGIRNAIRAHRVAENKLAEENARAVSGIVQNKVSNVIALMSPRRRPLTLDAMMIVFVRQCEWLVVALVVHQRRPWGPCQLRGFAACCVTAIAFD